jgi:hypothetical protein
LSFENLADEIGRTSRGRVWKHWFTKRWFESKISLATTFFFKRMLSLAILTRFEATFIH